MKTVTKTMTAFLGMLCLLALAGCPKKAVVKPEEPAPRPVSEETDTGVEFRWNLGTIHFDFDRSDIRPRDATILQGDYDQMQTAAARNQRPGITLEGNCDPVGTAEYNMALGMRRAEAAKAYLVRLGASSSQLTTISFGEEKLVTQDEMQYELNRRCEFKVAK
jgi:peptidoglycan-associated lipoprotein